MRTITRRAGEIAGALLVVLGMFWAGRESTHGIAAFWEHWWCPIPVVLIVLGLAAVISTRRGAPAA